MNYKDHILVIPEFVPNEFCDDVVEIMEQSDLTNAKVENQLAQLKDGNSAYHLSPYGVEIGKQQLASREFVVSSNVPSNLTKGSSSGTCSAVLYGNFAELFVGIWQNVEVMVDPYSDFSKATTGLRAIASLDCAVAHAESFAAIQDIVAT